MRNRELAADHLRRAEVRLRALDVLFEAESWADVIREAQETVELALKGLLRAHGVLPPRVHDVSAILLEERDRLPTALDEHLAELGAASKELRRDRELAFYGSEDLVPGDFYSRGDAEGALGMARRTVALVLAHVDAG